MTTKISRTCLAICTAIALGVANAAHAGVDQTGGHNSSQGVPGDPKAALRTLEVLATDYAFDIPALSVKDGETVRFVVRNRGEFLHEFNIGSPAMHAEHQAEMIAMMEDGIVTPTKINRSMMNADHSGVAMTSAADARSEARAGMAMGHDDPNSVLLEPGESKELVWTFAKAGALEFACNLPGHYEVGMMGKIVVTS